MSSKKLQELLVLLKHDIELREFINRINEFFKVYPFVTFTFLSREMNKDTKNISELLRPLKKVNLIYFKYELEYPECFNDVKVSDSIDELLENKNISCQFEMCNNLFKPKEKDIHIKIYPTDVWGKFIVEFFRKIQQTYQIAC